MVRDIFMVRVTRKNKPANQRKVKRFVTFDKAEAISKLSTILDKYEEVTITKDIAYNDLHTWIKSYVVDKEFGTDPDGFI